MKKKLMKSLMLIVAVVMLCLAVGMMASAETYGDYNYRVLDDGTVEITKYIGTDADVIVPAVLNDMVVSGLNDDGFCYNQSVVSVTISEGIKYIDGNTFEDAHNLKYIYIPASVSYINEYIFVENYTIEKIVVDENNKHYSTDESGVLFDKDKTKLMYFPATCKTNKYVMPKTVKEIHNQAFVDVVSLTEIVFSEALTSCQSFYMPISLKEITIPSTVEYIQDYSFEQCMSLTKITISDGVKKIGGSTFEHAPCLREIYIEGMNVEMSDFAKTEVYVENDKIDAWIEAIHNLFVERGMSLIKAYEGEEFAKLFSETLTGLDEPIVVATIYCHEGSTAETYAKGNGINYELTHFFKGEWTYDYDQMIRWRKCIHCDELETEDLETTSEGNVEIVEPINPDTKFEVDEFEKNSDNYILVENTVSENLEGNFEILKVFDINLKNKDGVHVQPDGTVKVKLPLDWSKDGDYKVYRVNDDGTLTDMNAYRQGSHMVFDTDHFSIYIIVEENVQGEAPEVTPDEEIKDNFFDKILDWFRSLLDLILSMFKK